MCPIKEKENRQLFILWPNLIPYTKPYKCVVTVLLLTSTPLQRGSKKTSGTMRGEEEEKEILT